MRLTFSSEQFDEVGVSVLSSDEERLDTVNIFDAEISSSLQQQSAEL